MIKNRTISKVTYNSTESTEVTVHLSVAFILLSRAVLSKLLLVNAFSTRIKLLVYSEEASCLFLNLTLHSYLYVLAYRQKVQEKVRANVYLHPGAQKCKGWREPLR